MIQRVRRLATASVAVMAALISGACSATSGTRPQAAPTRAADPPASASTSLSGSAPRPGTATDIGAGGKCASSHTGSLGPYHYSGITNSNGYNTYVANNMWGANAGSTQTICSSDPAHVSLTASAFPSDYTGVQTYPDVKQLFNDYTGHATWNQGSNMTDSPISDLHTLSSTYTIADPSAATGDWEAAYDIWLSNTPHNEIMIWVDTSSQRRSDNGARVISSSVSISGKSFTYQNYGGGLPQMVLNLNQGSATIDLLGVLKYLQSQGQISATAAIGELDFGWEICNTAGQSLRFQLSDYTLSAS